MKQEHERRVVSLALAETRIETREDGTEKIAGYAAVFYDGSERTQFDIWGDGEYLERIMPKAFDRALKENQDVRALFNHDPDYLLGRTISSTLELSTDKTGLRYVIDPPDTQSGRDTVTSVRRGDLSGSSFAFRVKAQVWREEERDGQTVMIREIEDVDLFDVGPVTFPAYEATSTELAKRSLEEWIAGQQMPTIERAKRLQKINEGLLTRNS